MLINYRWPGNVRELENVIERSMVMTDNARIDAQDLPESISRNESDGADEGARLNARSRKWKK